MSMFDKFLKKQKAKARYGVAIVQLTLLESDLINDKAGKADKRYWNECITELEWIKEYIEEAKTDLEHFKTMYDLYLEKYNKKEQGV